MEKKFTCIHCKKSFTDEILCAEHEDLCTKKVAYGKKLTECMNEILEELSRCRLDISLYVQDSREETIFNPHSVYFDETNKRMRFYCSSVKVGKLQEDEG